MSKLKKAAVIILSFAFLFSIKTRYGGNVTIRLNEPSSLYFSQSNYSNQILFSLLYENFFYLKKNGEIVSHIFDYHNYNGADKTVLLRLKSNLSFSDGSPVTVKNINVSFKLFLNTNLAAAKKLSRLIKNIRIEKNTFFMELIYDQPDIIHLLSNPALVLMAEKQGVFSGIFVPAQWEKEEYLLLKPNPFYPGGRTYLDSCKVLFYDTFYPDIFLSTPGFGQANYREFNAGIFQNIYLSFPSENIRQNTRIALYFLMKEYFATQNMAPLHSLTSDEESPISINIKSFSSRKVKSILRHSRINLYAMSSIKETLADLDQFLEARGINFTTVYLNNNQMIDFSDETPIKYMLVEKMFSRNMSMEEKVGKIIQEIILTRYTEKYLKLLNELKEFKYLSNEELLINQVTKIVQHVIKDGVILPLCQKKYSLFIKGGITGIDLDYYGRPLFQKARMGQTIEK